MNANVGDKVDLDGKRYTVLSAAYCISAGPKDDDGETRSWWVAAVTDDQLRNESSGRRLKRSSVRMNSVRAMLDRDGSLATR